MKNLLGVLGYIAIAFGVFLVVAGNGSAGPIVGIISIVIGISIVSKCNLQPTLPKHISKKHARKELIELKELLDNGIISKEEYENKSEKLKLEI